MAIGMNVEVRNMVDMFTQKNGMNAEEAAKVAWLNYALVAAMSTAIVHFTFVKADGTIREAHGTLDMNRITYTPNGNGRPAPMTVQRYWDTDKNAYRCFTKENLQSFQMVA